MFQRYLRFIKAVSINRIGLTGVTLTTASFLSFLILEAARILGFVTQAYAGLITYLAFPAIFLLGLVLIPIGWRRARKQTGLTGQELLALKFDEGETQGGFFGSRLVMTVGAFTLLNVIILTASTSRMLHFMEEPSFCGTACHSVMSPEWTTYQASPHARVACVDCHVGEGMRALVDSKLSGMRQMVAVATDRFERPIPTPVHNLRPARETCEKCHWPDKFYGRRLKTIVKFAEDATSTPEYSTVALKVDAGSGEEVSGIHWHIHERNEVRYEAADRERMTMRWVEVRQPDGSYKRFTNRNLRSDLKADGDSPHAHWSEVRSLDCIDCHNRATHIYERPGEAIDRRIERGAMDQSLPFLKREGLAAITGSYATREQAHDGIAARLTHFYRERFPEVSRTRADRIDEAVEVLIGIYDRNVHPGMKIEWGTYPSHLDHRGRGGCYRCHSSDFVADDGSTISQDCTLCHSILAQDSRTPYAYLEQPDSTSVDFRQHQYLRKEFLDSMP